jgi:glycopeptide antibiotics resistance protein
LKPCLYSDSTWITLVRQWAFKLMALSSLVIIACTLYPFRVEGNMLNDLELFSRLAGNMSDRRDIVANILLFMPFGLGLTGCLWLRRVPMVWQLGLVFGLSAAFSSSVEIIQLFLPSRFPSYVDVLTNTSGGVCGLLWFYGAGYWTLGALAAVFLRIQRLFARWRTAHLWASVWGYLAFALVIMLALYSSSLRIWDLDLPLQIGGTQGQQANWSGSVTDLVWRDRTLTPAEVAQMSAQSTPAPDKADSRLADSRLAHYGLKNAEDLADQTGRSPKLDWQGVAPPTSDGGVRLSPQHWLQTPGTAAAINAGIQKTSQFNVSATIAVSPESYTDGEFHRIIALANGDDLGNFALGQFQSYLLIWVQTGVSRRRFYQTFVMNTFADTQPHRIGVDYVGFVLKVYVDGKLTLVRSMLPNRYAIVGGLLMFLPLSLLLSLIANRRSLTLGRSILLGAVVVLPPILVEIGCAQIGDRSTNESILLLSLMIMGGTFYLFRNPPILLETPPAHDPENIQA